LLCSTLDFSAGAAPGGIVKWSFAGVFPVTDISIFVFVFIADAFFFRESSEA